MKKNRCFECNEKLRKSHLFCPNCGTKIKNSGENWGMLGRNDSLPKDQIPRIVGGGIFGGIVNKMMNSMIKELSKEMDKEFNEINKQPKTRIKLMINGKEITPFEEINSKKNNTKILPIEFSKENLEKWKKLKKKEPNSKLRRIDDKIKYEIEIPEVNSIQDISIIKLENSLEIRAIGKNIGYVKNISIDLPLKKYTFLKGILTLELDTE